MLMLLLLFVVVAGCWWLFFLFSKYFVPLRYRAMGLPDIRSARNKCYLVEGG
jgi:hypothetical protein